jgi:SNF2 family DNA or RNA helicase
MTGTPVENRLQDLWSIMDVLVPGLLGASKEFEKRYPPTNRPALAQLKKQLTEREERPAHILRRLKQDQLKGMPAKQVHKYKLPMPPIQANAYRDVVVRAAAAASAGNLGKAECSVPWRQCAVFHCIQLIRTNLLLTSRAMREGQPASLKF